MVHLEQELVCVLCTAYGLDATPIPGDPHMCVRPSTESFTSPATPRHPTVEIGGFSLGVCHGRFEADDVGPADWVAREEAEMS